MKKEVCPHHDLYFGFGDFYIFCIKCGKNWSISDQDELKLNNNLSGKHRKSDTWFLVQWINKMGLVETYEFVKFRYE